MDYPLIAEFSRALETWVGKGMRVVIRPARGHEQCPIEGCTERFSDRSGLTCPTHNTYPHRVYIDITGYQVEDGRLRITKAIDGTPLQLLSAVNLKNEIVYKIDHNKFNPRQYMDNGKRLLFKCYKQKYLAKMRERASRPPEAPGWLAGSSLDDIEKYHRNYLYLFDSYHLHDITTNLIENTLDGLRMKSDKERLAGNTIKAKTVGHLRHLLRYALKLDDLDSVPEMPTYELDRREITILTKPQQREILDKVPEKDRPVLEWPTETGRRENE
jgi:hypothetical protein